MFATPLDARRKEIMQAVVEEYIETALPVSSQIISRRLRWRLSAATVRNVMMELDELGLITQPHTSAGRIPTDTGYRYYINSLMELETLSPKEKELIESRYPARTRTFDELMAAVLRMLSNFSGYTSLAFSSFGRDRVYIERTSCILEQPEFQDVRKLQPILKTLEREDVLTSIMKEDLQPDGIKVHVGKENSYADIQDCSLVISNFKIKNRNTGSLGIIGPRRMSYARVVSVVDYMVQTLNENFK